MSCGCGACTLLGPEGPDENPYLWAFCCLSVRGGGERFRPYFENYTVDASIFSAAFGLCCNDDLKDH